MNPKKGGGKQLKSLSKPILDFGLAKVRVRLSFERVYDDQTEKDCALGRGREAATSTGCTEGRASAIIRCRGDHGVAARFAQNCTLSRTDTRPPVSAVWPEGGAVCFVHATMPKGCPARYSVRFPLQACRPRSAALYRDNLDIPDQRRAPWTRPCCRFNFLLR